MGNHISSQSNLEKKSECLICLEQISSRNCVKCIRCKILLHNDCEKTYRNEKGYCKCPHCQQIGTICTHS